jgi:hypothetical protein
MQYTLNLSPPSKNVQSCDRGEHLKFLEYTVVRASLACCVLIKQYVISGDGSFYPSTQRHYRRLIYYYIVLLHVLVVRPSSERKYINN